MAIMRTQNRWWPIGVPVGAIAKKLSIRPIKGLLTAVEAEGTLAWEMRIMQKCVQRLEKIDAAPGRPRRKACKVTCNC